MLSQLIEALQIFKKYKDAAYPTHCEHDILLVVDIPEDAVSAEDAAKLDELGFSWMKEYECWGSFRYGSA